MECGDDHHHLPEKADLVSNLPDFCPNTEFLKQVEKDALIAKQSARSLTPHGIIQDVANLLPSYPNHDVWIRQTLGTNTANKCLRQLRHTFIVLLAKHPEPVPSVQLPSSEVVIDITFQDSFSVPRASERYKRILEVLPEVFVGTPETLHSAIDFLAPEIAKSFASMDMSVPPWRTKEAFRSRWFSTPRRDGRPHADAAVLPPASSRSLTNRAPPTDQPLSATCAMSADQAMGESSNVERDGHVLHTASPNTPAATSPPTAHPTQISPQISRSAHSTTSWARQIDQPPPPPSRPSGWVSVPALSYSHFTPTTSKDHTPFTSHPINTHATGSPPSAPQPQLPSSPASPSSATSACTHCGSVELMAPVPPHRSRGQSPPQAAADTAASHPVIFGFTIPGEVAKSRHQPAPGGSQQRPGSCHPCHQHHGWQEPAGSWAVIAPEHRRNLPGHEKQHLRMAGECRQCSTPSAPPTAADPVWGRGLKASFWTDEDRGAEKLLLPVHKVKLLGR